MTKKDFERYVEACNYPGIFDDAAVEKHLTTYLSALGVKRKVVRLSAGWSVADHPSLQRNIAWILNDFAKRNPKARAALDARAALAARAALDARDARDARDALDALDALAARDALDALAARDARDALSSLHGFAAWCIQNGSYYWWGWDLSWIVTTAFGARQNKKPEIDKWATPLLEAFIAGAWFLYWTDDTLFWVAKPIVHRDPVPNVRRLHNDKYAAIESDVENLYYWHGVMVPAFVVVRPDWITIKHIEGEKNAEVRRVMIERYGEARYVTDSGMKAVATDPRFGDLYVQHHEVGKPTALVFVTNSTAEPDGTFRRYALPINPALYDGDAGRIPQAAVASTWRTTRGGKELAFKRWQDYQPIVET